MTYSLALFCTRRWLTKIQRWCFDTILERNAFPPPQRPVYLIVDALHECPNNSGLSTSREAREEVLDLFQDLVGLYHLNLHISVISRPEINIRTIIDPHRNSLHDQSGQRKDIFDYISSLIYLNRRMRRWREEDKRLVIKILSKRADGMYVCRVPFDDRFSCCHIGSGGVLPTGNATALSTARRQGNH